ncbi:MAG TPA: hypothetical protein VFN95_07795, partial [Flavitalea sp.]|nr:hypothetical protein [Flavitalea sp.]
TAAEVIGWESLDGVKYEKSWNESVGRIIQQHYKNKVVEKSFGAPVATANEIESPLLAVG